MITHLGARPEANLSELAALLDGAVTVSPERGRNGADQAVRAWIAADPDPASRAELEALLDAGDDDALASRFAGRLGVRDRGPAGRARRAVRTA